MLFSTKNVNLNLPYKKFSPVFVGPFRIHSLLGTNVVCLNHSERFQVRGIKWKTSSTIGVVRVHCVNVSFVGRILIPFMTLGFIVNSLLLLYFNLMISFWPNMFDFVRNVSRTPRSNRLLKPCGHLVHTCYLSRTMTVTRYWGLHLLHMDRLIWLLRRPFLLSLQE